MQQLTKEDKQLGHHSWNTQTQCLWIKETMTQQYRLVNRCQEVFSGDQEVNLKVET